MNKINVRLIISCCARVLLFIFKFVNDFSLKVELICRIFRIDLILIKVCC